MLALAAVLDREEYIEQAYFFRTLRERLLENMPTQEVLTHIHEEILSITRLPLAIQFLGTELKHTGLLSSGFAKLPEDVNDPFDNDYQGQLASGALVEAVETLATDAAAQFPPLARDLTASCIRKHLADRPVNEIEDVSNEARSACKELSDLEPNLLGALNLLVNYLNSLNQLASGEITSYDKQIDGFAAKVQATGGFGDAPVSAIKGLAKFLEKLRGLAVYLDHLLRQLVARAGFDEHGLRPGANYD